MKIRTMLIIAILVASITSVMANGSPQNGGEPKMTICHYPPGNEEQAHTIEIPVSAWVAHQAHGDVEGPCVISPVPEVGTLVLTSIGTIGILLVSRKYRQN